MRISIIQPDTVWESPKQNFNRLEYQISLLESDTDIIILPEMFNTGFSMDPEKLSEIPGGETFRWMTKISLEKNAGICGSYLIHDRNKFFNRWVFISPENNKSWHYNKRHLFRMTNEEQFLTQGNRRLTFRFRDIRISANICYDLRFPVWSRNTENFDLLINAANWPEARRDVWITLLRARAIENQCYVAGANRIGTDGNGYTYSGESMIIDPKGRIIIKGEKNKECTISANISMTELKAFRKKFPVLKDADRFTLNR
jgi:omega-amidase